jgi:hypothetical protein
MTAAVQETSVHVTFSYLLWLIVGITYRSTANADTIAAMHRGMMM